MGKSHGKRSEKERGLLMGDKARTKRRSQSPSMGPPQTPSWCSRGRQSSSAIRREKGNGAEGVGRGLGPGQPPRHQISARAQYGRTRSAMGGRSTRVRAWQARGTVCPCGRHSAPLSLFFHLLNGSVVVFSVPARESSRHWGISQEQDR